MLILLFICITLLSVALFYFGTGNDKRVLIFYSLWIVAIGGLSYTSFFTHTQSFPPRMIIVIIPSVLSIIYFYKKIHVFHLSPNYLIALHTLRLPVELTLYQLFLLKKIPVLMTYKGWNFDILTGISAILILSYSLFKKKKSNRFILIIWNYIGLLFLSIIVVTALLSAPSPVQQFAFDQPNIAILEFPFTFLPAVIVPIVLVSHLLCLKKLNTTW